MQGGPFEDIPEADFIAAVARVHRALGPNLTGGGQALVLAPDSRPLARESGASSRGWPAPPVSATEGGEAGRRGATDPGASARAAGALAGSLADLRAVLAASVVLGRFDPA